MRPKFEVLPKVLYNTTIQTDMVLIGDVVFCNLVHVVLG